MTFSLANKIQVTETDILFDGQSVYGDEVPECHVTGTRGFRMLTRENEATNIELDVIFPDPRCPENVWKLELSTYDNNGANKYCTYIKPELFMMNLLKYLAYHLLEVNGSSVLQWKSLIELTNVLRTHNENVRQHSEYFSQGCPVLSVVKTGIAEVPLEVSKEQEGLAQGITALINTIT